MIQSGFHGGYKSEIQIHSLHLDEKQPLIIKVIL